MKKLAMITGASAGIGEATALKLAERGFDLLLVARRVQRLEELAKKCREVGAGEVLIRHLDVTSPRAVEEFYKDSSLQAAFKSLHVLVNSAGLAKGVDKMHEAKIADWETMMDTNVMGLMYVTRGALPWLVENKGHIVNLGSVAGRWTYPGGGVYCATKAAVRALTEGLRADLSGTRVRVTNIAPGMVKTEFTKTRLGGSEKLSEKVYENFAALTALDVAECIEWSISRPPHVNIQEMILFPTDQASVTQTYREAPQGR